MSFWPDPQTGGLERAVVEEEQPLEGTEVRFNPNIKVDIGDGKTYHPGSYLEGGDKKQVGRIFVYVEEPDNPKKA